MKADEALARLRWRARRGMRELDELLLGFLDRHGRSLDTSRRAALTRLLEAPDPILCDWLLHGVIPPDSALVELIHDIRRTARP